jgi:hypothetical protein
MFEATIGTEGHQSSILQGDSGGPDLDSNGVIVGINDAYQAVPDLSKLPKGADAQNLQVLEKLPQRVTTNIFVKVGTKMKREFFTEAMNCHGKEIPFVAQTNEKGSCAEGIWFY